MTEPSTPLAVVSAITGSRRLAQAMIDDLRSTGYEIVSAEAFVRLSEPVDPDDATEWVMGVPV